MWQAPNQRIQLARRGAGDLTAGRRAKRFQSIEAVARRRLRQLEIAGRLDDLRIPPGHRLEPLKGDRAGQHSIRSNDQYRVCFRWTAGGAEDVELVDYHQECEGWTRS